MTPKIETYLNFLSEDILTLDISGKGIKSLYLKIVSNSMCGSTKDETDKNINKIITNIAKEVTIDKN